MSPARGAAALLIGAVAWIGGCSGAPSEADLIFRGGTVIDGGNRPPRVADVAIRGDTIVAVGDVSGWKSLEDVDASGLIVAPGFIDLHSHADLILLAPRERQRELLEAKIRQGVTSVLVGNCGLGTAPAAEAAAPLLAAVNGWMTPDGVETSAGSIGDYLDRLERGGVVLNVGTLVPHGPVRISAMGLEAGAPDAEQLDAMRADVSAGLEAGAYGLSTGLIYPPGMYSDTAELTELAREVAARGRIYTSHVRGSSETLLQATRELIDVARGSGARVHHSHMEAVGEAFWGDIGPMLKLEDEARVAGIRISHDIFLYTRAATMMAAIYPPWSLEGGVPALLERLRDPVLRERIRTEIAERTPEWPPWQSGGWPHNLVGAVGWDGIRVADAGGEGADVVGRDLATIAAARGRDPFDVVADLMLEHGGQVGQLVDEISGRERDEAGLERILRHGAAAVISDAEDYGRGAPHPAHAGAFPRALRWSRERPLIPLEEMVHRMTGYPAKLIRLRDRGEIQPGYKADIVLFDESAVTDNATWETPRRHASGIAGVWINGHAIVRDDVYLDGTPGRVLRAGRR